MNEKIKQFIAFGVCSVVALAVCLGVLIITVKNLDSGVNVTQNETIINKTELDSSKESLTKYINRLLSKTEDRFVKTKTYTDVSINDLEILNSVEDTEKDLALLNFAKDKMLSVIDGYYRDDFIGSFEKADSEKISLFLDKNDLNNASFSIGQVNEKGEIVFDNEGNPVDNEYYYLTYEVDIENKTLDTWTHNKTIQKAVESFRISKEQKQYLKTFKEIIL